MKTKNILKNRQVALPAILISAALVAMIAGNAFANIGYNHDNFEVNPENQAHREAVKEAISSGDYSTFAELTSDKDHFSVINEGNFSSLMEIHNLRESGDREGAKALMDELGLEPPKKMRRMQKKENRQERRGEIKEAFASGDYSTFLEVAPDKLKEKVTEENFQLMVKAHELREAGDHESAKAIMDELGIKPPHKRMNRGNFQNQ